MLWRVRFGRRTGRRDDLVLGLLGAVAAPLAGLGLMFGASMLNAYGPDWLDNWAGGLLRFAMIMAGMALVVFTNIMFGQVVVFFGSFFALGLALFAASDLGDALALRDRGMTTSCVILHIDERTETHTTTDANGNTSTTTDTYYDHRLRCGQPRITAMTTGSPAGKVGEGVTVAYDPEGRVGPRPAEGAFDTGSALLVLCVGGAVGIGLRVLHVLFIGDRW